MKRKMLGCLTVVWILSILCATGAYAAQRTFEGRFSTQALMEYATQAGTAAYDKVTFSADTPNDISSWQYSTIYDPSLSYAFDQQAVHGSADLTVLLWGSGDELGSLFLMLDGSIDQKITPRLVQISVQDHLYWIDLKKARDVVTVEANGEDGYDLDMVMAFGTTGQQLLNDLYASDFAFSLRLYDSKELCFSFEQLPQSGQSAYRLFYEGLVKSRFLDENGRVQASCWEGLQRVDKMNSSSLPKISVYPLDERLWLGADNTSVPKTIKSIKPIAAEEREAATTLEFTGVGDWGHSKGTPWIKIQVRNTDKKKTVSKVSFLYYCTDKDGNLLVGADTGEIYGAFTLEHSIKPKKKYLFPKYSFQSYDKDAYNICTAIQEVTYSDGTVVTVSDRDLSFTTWVVK